MNRGATPAPRSPIALTMGDPAGVGPELVVKAWHRRRAGAPPWLWVGDPAVLADAGRRLGRPLALLPVDHPREARAVPPDLLPVLPTRSTAGPLIPGHPDPRHAAATVESIETACHLAMGGAVRALVTPPVNKAVLHAGGLAVPGHTELLGACCGVAQPVMMLVGRGLRVVPATIHQSLATVPDSLTAGLLEGVLRITHQALVRDFGLAAPRVAVAGLNPHAGEGGAFGDEELRVIGPVCRRLAAEWGAGLLRGPLPADTLFHKAARRTFDAVVGMYHDQVLIPLKMLAFGHAVNVTLGLPVVRTSVDHGTAYDLAGTGLARVGSLEAALDLADRIATNREAAAPTPAPPHP